MDPLEAQPLSYPRTPESGGRVQQAGSPLGRDVGRARHPVKGRGSGGKEKFNLLPRLYAWPSDNGHCNQQLTQRGSPPELLPQLGAGQEEPGTPSL